MYANWHTQQANGWAGLLCMPIGIHNIIDMHNNEHANGLYVCQLAYTTTH
jgi:hypothetical protein